MKPSPSASTRRATLTSFFLRSMSLSRVRGLGNSVVSCLIVTHNPVCWTRGVVSQSA